jgi:hypothetical protein
MTLEEVQAFGKYRSENGAGAGAVGKYQFMPTTLFGRKDKKGNFLPGLVQQLNIPMSEKFTKEVQDKLQDKLHAQDVATLRRLGIPITPGYEYMAHYIGAGGAAAVHAQRNTDKTVAEVMIENGQSVGNNRELKELKAKDFESILAGRLAKKGGLASPHSSANNTGDKTNDISNMNKDLKDSSAPQNKTNVNNIISQSTNEPDIVVRGKVDDRSPYDKKK